MSDFDNPNGQFYVGNGGFIGSTVADIERESKRARKARDNDAARQKEHLSRPVKPIHSAKDGWRGFFGRLSESILNLGR